MGREHPIVWDDATVARFWDYHGRRPHDAGQYFSQVFGTQIIRYARLPGRRSLEVLDFGCGPGFLWEHVRARTRWRYSGLDFSEGSIAALRARAVADPRFAGAHHVRQLPSGLGEGSFDVVLLIEVLEHLGDAWLTDTLTEVRRLLKPGGVCVVTTPNEEDLAAHSHFCPECGAVFHQWQHVRSWSAATLVETFRNHHMRSVWTQTLDLTPFHPVAATLRLAGRLLGRTPGRPHLLAAFERA